MEIEFSCLLIMTTFGAYHDDAAKLTFKFFILLGGQWTPHTLFHHLDLSVRFRIFRHIVAASDDTVLGRGRDTGGSLRQEALRVPVIGGH